MKAHKNSGNSTPNHWRNKALFGTILLMIAGLFFSRAVLSSSIIVFVLLALARRDFLQQLKNIFSASYLPFLTLLFFIPAISGLWSSNMEQWSHVLRIKLPLLALPAAFAGSWQLSAKQWEILAAAFLLAVFGGCVWGLIDYWQDPTGMHEAYLKAKTILTPLENDHVRYSWLVSVAIALCCLLFLRTEEKIRRWLLLLLAVFFVLYLHILSARTGLISFYLFLIIYGGWLLVRSKNRKWAAGIALLVLALPLVAFYTLPTFKARLQYHVYDLSFVRKSEYLPGSSDGARMMSLKAGWQVLKENPLGAGAGDVMAEADKWYAANVPQVLPTDKFYPSSEWLMYGGFAGWLGVVLFTAIMVVPFVYRPAQYQVFWIAYHATAAFSFLFDMGLEVQYGVFLYAFTTCWWWKWFGGIRRHFPKFAA